jgi:hypothetical protein
MAVDKSLLLPTLIQHPISILRLWMIANRTQNCNAPQGARLKGSATRRHRLFDKREILQLNTGCQIIKLNKRESASYILNA